MHIVIIFFIITISVIHIKNQQTKIIYMARLGRSWQQNVLIRVLGTIDKREMHSDQQHKSWFEARMCVHVAKVHTGRVTRNAWHVDCRICNVPTNLYSPFCKCSSFTRTSVNIKKIFKLTIPTNNTQSIVLVRQNTNHNWNNKSFFFIFNLNS